MKKDLLIHQVWQNYKRTGAKRYRDILIKHYLPLVRIIAEKIHEHLPRSVDINDLVSTGILGLISAINLYDQSRGVKFETYCVGRIRGAMLDELRNQDWVPRLVRSKIHQLRRVSAQLETKLGRPPSVLEIAQALRLSLAEYNELCRQTTPTAMLSFHYKPNLDSDKELPEAINLLYDKKADQPFKKLFYEDLVNYLKNSLSEKERLILELYFYEDLTLKEIGVILNVSESRVSQLFADIMKRLQRYYQRYQSEWLS